MDEQIQEASIEKTTGKKINTEILLYFVLGVLLGIVIKTEAIKRWVVGFEDYKLAGIQRDYDINKIEAGLIEKAKKQAEEAKKAQVQNPNPAAAPSESAPSAE